MLTAKSDQQVCCDFKKTSKQQFSYSLGDRFYFCYGLILNTIARSFKTGKCMIPNDKVMFIIVLKYIKKKVRLKLRQFGVSLSFSLFP